MAAAPARAPGSRRSPSRPIDSVQPDGRSPRAVRVPCAAHLLSGEACRPRYSRRNSDGSQDLPHNPTEPPARGSRSRRQQRGRTAPYIATRRSARRPAKERSRKGQYETRETRLNERQELSQRSQGDGSEFPDFFERDWKRRKGPAGFRPMRRRKFHSAGAAGPRNARCNDATGDCVVRACFVRVMRSTGG
jgi:hypothetical protein